MTFLADEQSPEDGRPREGYEFQFPAYTTRIAAADRDVFIGGNRFSATPGMRGEVGVNSLTNLHELEVTLPLDHAIPQRWFRQALPPHKVLVDVWRKQLRSGESERVWIGEWTSCSKSGHEAKLLITSRIGRAMARRLPVISLGRGCPHMLYDAGCKVNALNFTVITTLTSVDGPDVKVASVGGNPDQWFRFGRLIHLPTGEPLAISDQDGLDLTLQFPIVDAFAGDAVAIQAGCDHTIDVCLAKFANQLNYGGGPHTPHTNPMLPGNGLGIIVQT